MRVFLAVHLPRLQLEVFRPRWLPESANGSVVLDRGKVLIADGVAKSAGVRVGMKRGGVLTQAPEVEMYERDPSIEHAAQREVAVALMQFSPDVAVLDEAVVVADIGASLRLFGGLLAICRQTKGILEAIGLTARISAAPTGQGAWLLARNRNRRALKLDSLERQLLLITVPRLPIDGCRLLAPRKARRCQSDFRDQHGCWRSPYVS
ncbi:nucleotidyltransferase/DNA polymerase involved in DNA repair [Paraburkholderia sp. WC7.3d]